MVVQTSVADIAAVEGLGLLLVEALVAVDKVVDTEAVVRQFEFAVAGLAAGRCFVSVQVVATEWTAPA